VRAEPLARITVLISGRGSNLGALLEAIDAGGIDGAVTQVISNRADARGLDLAKARGIATRVVDHRGYADRAAFDDALQATVEQGEPDLVVLAGFMRVLGEAFVRAFDGRLLNIHPSLLPLYPGLHTHRRALADGVRVHGCTVHFVTNELDGGPIVAQGAVGCATARRAVAASAMANTVSTERKESFRLFRERRMRGVAGSERSGF